ncbi:AAA family ATPase [Actinomadura sp. HBU206391]|uniref:AAA family ATPase n=1 Tax=Actinomadura sp. HBU206391 TaxID=2731692 RepID=UPI00164F2992|nr:SMC family ATPase [Actinomadura sp. HBU206391]MBC6460457.1 SMC family ATPase [Actinomadura sp. HBU206391]
MRLHRLEVTAFGPFAGTVTIDFDTLSDAGLFLIHGQTGAGKTSVLDALCFALYGQVPGARNAVKGLLRSDHAALGAAPRVLLELTVRGRRLRITRSPSWERPKIRGTGTTSEHAKVIVEEYEDGSWLGRSARLDEAGHFIGGLLGMTADQFCQVALLPQGEFAAFLRAGAEERRKVLERLFATEVFTQVEKWLADRRAVSGRRAEQLRAEVESTADRIAETAGAERPGGEAAAGRGLVPAPRREQPPGDGGHEMVTPWATELEGQLAAVRTETESLVADAEAALSAAREKAERGRGLAERQRRHADALRRREAIDARAGERAVLAGREAAAARADRVLPLINAVTTRTRQAERTCDAAAVARAALSDLVPSSAPDDVLHKAERDRRDEAAGLERLRDDAARLRDMAGEIAGVAGRLAGLEQEEAGLSALLAELPELVDEGRAELDGARLRAAGRPAAQAVLQDAGRRIESARRRDVVRAALADAEIGHQAVVDTAQELRDRLQEIRQARLDGMAAVLAGELAAGEPCRVCGSAEHPDPAVALDGTPDEADEERAQAAYDGAQAGREDAAARLAELRAELDGLLEISEEPVDVLADELAAAEEALAAVDADAAQTERLEERLLHAEAELTRARDRRETVLQTLAENRTRHTELTAETIRLTERLDEARGADPTLEARIDRLAGEAELLRAAAEATRLARTAEEELVLARSAASDAASDEGFASLDDARDAALPADSRAGIKAEIKAFDDEDATVRALLDDPELVTAAELPAPELPALEAGLVMAESAYTAVVSARDRARQRHDRLRELRVTLAARVAAWRPAAERYLVAARLAGLASGQPGVNLLSMRLSAYVLAARLEQVVAAANERLSRMSAGRYALAHTIDRAAGDRRGGSGGLGLRVTDAWTGQDRDPVTLSGGESFITSLALALGLADVVTAEAGGTEIGTLFVDEGFGTLDEETLDEVMDVLDGLRDGGRAVGIVSHVAELRTRIPAQLRVRKDRTGSTAAVTV